MIAIAVRCFVKLQVGRFSSQTFGDEIYLENLKENYEKSSTTIPHGWVFGCRVNPARPPRPRITVGKSDALPTWIIQQRNV